MGDTGTIVGIVAAVVVVVLLVWFFVVRGKGGESALPPETPEPKRPEPEPRPKAELKESAASKPEPKPEPKKPETKKPEPKPEPAVEAKKPEPKPEPAAEAKKPEPKPEAKKPEPVVEPAPAKPEPAPSRPAATKKASEDDVKALKKGLASTRGGFIARLAQLFGRKKEIDPQLLDEIQEVLITADIGVKTSEKILEKLKARMDGNELADEDAVWEALREEARAILGRGNGGLDLGRKPSVILVVGVNGVGKTTTIGKLASRYKEEGRKVILAAGDTFRAAAVLQLEVWGRRVGCDVVKGKERADPASVIFEAVKKAKDEGADLVIADTAGRLHTKTNLMEELKKVVRTAEKALERPVDEILLVLDSTTGQNAIQQAQLFKDAIPVSGIALTKLDGTAKGGVILGIVDEHSVPVHFVGIGERVEDLREFDSASFVEALFAKPDDETAAA
jgi:fused signal recognition particle receptor